MQTTRQLNQLFTFEGATEQEQVPSSGPVAPLTSQNLSTLSRKRSLSTASSTPNSDTDPDTNSQLSGANSHRSEPFNMPDHLTVMAMRHLLDHNQIYIDKTLAREQGAAIIAKAMETLDGKRGSDWSGSKVAEIMEIIHYNKDQNEATFLCEVFHNLLGIKRSVSNDVEGERTYIDQSWSKSFLRTKWDNEFVGNDVPTLKIPDDDVAYWKAILAAFPRIKSPKPDVSYSIDSNAYDSNLKLKKVIDFVHCQLGGRGRLPYFFRRRISIHKAENQAMTTGATMCEHSRRCRRAFTAQPNQEPQPVTTPTPDAESFVFTIAIDPDQVKLFVNWILVHPPLDNTYHMHHLRTYTFNNAEHVAILHHDLDNILDWGVGKRKRDFDTLAEASLESGIVPPGPPPGPPSAKKARTK
ncbi:uncharacterized protein KY384_004667 [Bacidia gigantensis]|uniref:uncharacterized protein n=1 Tax=Bacidia gigantensis TaxID=2732470 RepID=UPI001D038871|nr:uncharacterized protein KY384_004667 [Bacidia gigantensis]KAG8530629.1 hypothetical protein KY384_004667 [Bacidia gigantensis]